MTRLSRLLLASLPLLGGLAHGAEPAAWLGKPDCRIAPLMPAPVNGAVSWSGACKDGYAEGKGVIEWRVPKDAKHQLEAVLVRGEVSGEATLRYPVGKYIGSFSQGVPHGAGYFEFAKGDGRYEGGVVNGQRDGAGVQIDMDGSTYEGQWKDGKRHGSGKAVFTLGGSYDGEWRAGSLHGKGRIVYNGSGRTYVGEFADDRAIGAAPAPSGDHESFALRREHPELGSHIRKDRAIGAAPIDAAWQALTPAQQSIVRNSYPALDDGDEPPYPLKGTRSFYAAISNLYRKFSDYQGDALVYITVGADGVPVTVSTYGVTHAEFGRYLAMVAMMQRFKPGLCAGTPCQMIYPLKFRFYLD